MWLVIERGVAIWGLGHTQEEALGDANRWLYAEDGVILAMDDVATPNEALQSTQFVWEEVSELLGLLVKQAVDNEGGNLENTHIRSLLGL